MNDDLDLDDFGIDIGTVMEGGHEDESGPTLHRAGVRILVIDPGKSDSPLSQALERTGFGSALVETGGQAMQAIGAGQFAALVCATSGDDDDWRRFLTSGVRQRYGDFPVLFAARTPTESERDRLIGLGASAVIPAPLPPTRELGRIIDTLLGLEPVMEPAAADAAELALLKRRLRDAEEATRIRDKEIEELKHQFMHAIDEVSQRTTESTGLRSEVSLLRDRASLMKDRLERAVREVRWLKQENERLASDQAQAPSGISPSDEIERQLQELRGLLAALLPFDQALAQAVKFLEELAVVAGPRAQMLQKHVRQLGLLRDVFGRIRARIGDKGGTRSS